MTRKSKIIISLIVIVVAIFILVKFVPKKATPPMFKAPDLRSNTISVETAKALEETMKKTYAIDKDFDGIADTDEAKYGTSLNLADTDGDGVLDSDEINKYHTNPLKSDTDGDGFSDGYEIKRGFNPNGPGKLTN